MTTNTRGALRRAGDVLVTVDVVESIPPIAADKSPLVRRAALEALAD